MNGIKREIQGFLQRCSNSFHDVNGKKTNETVTDFRDELVEQVSAYKYLGVDDKSVFQECALNQSKNPQQRTFFLGKPKQFRSDSCVLQTFYKSALRTVLFWLSVHFWKHACSTSEENTVHDQGSRWNQWVHRSAAQLYNELIFKKKNPFHQTFWGKKIVKQQNSAAET